MKHFIYVLTFCSLFVFAGATKVQADCSYKVRRGDTFSRIEFRHYLARKGLRDLNSRLAHRHSKRLAGFDYIKPGDRINLGGYCDYRGKAGERVDVIAKTHNVKATTLRSANPRLKVKSGRYLAVSQRVHIPNISATSANVDDLFKSLRQLEAESELRNQEFTNPREQLAESTQTLTDLRQEVLELKSQIEYLILPWYRKWWHEIINKPPNKNSNGKPDLTLLSVLVVGLTENLGTISGVFVVLIVVIIYQTTHGQYHQSTYGRLTLLTKNEGAEGFWAGIRRRRRQQKLSKRKR